MLEALAGFEGASGGQHRDDVIAFGESRGDGRERQLGAPDLLTLDDERDGLAIGVRFRHRILPLLSIPRSRVVPLLVASGRVDNRNGWLRPRRSLPRNLSRSAGL